MHPNRRRPDIKCEKSQVQGEANALPFAFTKFQKQKGAPESDG